MGKRRRGKGEPTGRRLFRPRDLAIVAGAAVLCLLVLAFRPMLSKPGAVAAVFLDSKEILRVPLDETDDYRIDLRQEYGVPVSFEVKAGGIRYVDVVCPDHICERTGTISLEGQTAVCMPNRVAVVILLLSF